MNDILITGVGPVSAIGIGRAAWQQGLLKGESGEFPLSLFAADIPTAEVRGLNLDEILASQKTYLDRTGEFALAAAQLALNDAGLTPANYDKWRAGVVMGSEYGSLPTLQTFTAGVQQKGVRAANSILFSHSYLNTPGSLVAIEFGLGGYHGAFAGADAGMQALESAREALQLGRADIIMVIGVDVISESLLRALVAEGTLNDVLGEGACALVLETAEHAAARGAVGTPWECPLPACPESIASVRKLLGVTFAAEPLFVIAASCLNRDSLD